jgi:hypothetical protein
LPRPFCTLRTTFQKRVCHGTLEPPKPIQALTGTAYEVKGDVKFSPEPDMTYTVKGVLGEKYSAVWIESKETGELVETKIELNGNSELGFFEK